MLLFPAALDRFCPTPRPKLFPLNHEYDTSNWPDARSDPEATQSPFHRRFLRLLAPPLHDGVASNARRSFQREEIETTITSPQRSSIKSCNYSGRSEEHTSELQSLR